VRDTASEMQFAVNVLIEKSQINCININNKQTKQMSLRPLGNKLMKSAVIIIYVSAKHTSTYTVHMNCVC